MKRGKYQRPRFGKRQRLLRCLGIPDLADQNNVRPLPQRIEGADVVTFHIAIGSDFALGNDAFALWDQCLDWVFDGYDMSRPGFIYLIEQRGDRCRFALTSIAYDEDQAVVQLGKILRALPQSYLVQRHRFGRETA